MSVAVTNVDLDQAARAQGVIGADGYFTQSDEEFDLEMAPLALQDLQAALLGAETAGDLKAALVNEQRPRFFPLDT
jgi:hypothetical protein